MREYHNTRLQHDSRRMWLMKSPQPQPGSRTVPVRPFLIKAYLASRVKPLAKQMLIRARTAWNAEDVNALQ